MSKVDFEDIAQLVNHSRTTNIELSPSKGKDGRWALFQGQHRIHASTILFNVLYLYSDATQEDMRVAAREITSDTHVVYPSSVEKKLSTLETKYPEVLDIS